jgi:hypothetical protein
MSNLVKPLTWLAGVVFVVVGAAGFFVDGQLLWFEVDGVHSAVHLLTGLIALYAVSKGQSTAKGFLLVFGFVYALVTILGFLTGSLLGLFAINGADNWLHLGTAIALLAVGFMGGEEGASPAQAGAEEPLVSESNPEPPREDLHEETASTEEKEDEIVEEPSRGGDNQESSDNPTEEPQAERSEENSKDE